MKTERPINVDHMPFEVVLAHREGVHGEDIVEAWYLRGDEHGGMRLLREFRGAVLFEEKKEFVQRREE